MSGVPSCEWSVPFQPRRRALILGKQLGFEETDDPQKLLEFLQSVPVEKLIATKVCVTKSEEVLVNNNMMYGFVPVVERDFGKYHFIIEKPDHLVKKGKVNEADVLIGHTNEETLCSVAKYVTLGLLYNQFRELLVPRKLLYECNATKILELSDIIYRHYFGEKPINETVMTEMVTFFSDTSFVCHIARFFKMYPKMGQSKLFAYIFSSVSERNVYGKRGEKYGLTGASHLDDLFYMFHSHYHNLKADINNESFKLVDLFTSVLTNFAKFGHPSPDDCLGIWPEYDPKTEAYANIGDSITVHRELSQDVYNFWKSVYERAGVDYV